MGTFEEEEIGLLVEYSKPFEPIVPSLPSPLASLARRPLPRRPRAILFDVYGTLFLSASGEIGTADSPSREAHFLEAYRIVCGKTLPVSAGPIMARTYRGAIAEQHEASRAKGLPFPEVNILAVWRAVLNRLDDAGLDAGPVDVEQLAIAYETQSNPVWPMPDARSTLARMAGAGLPLGIVSNAQFYTPMLFPALVGATIEELGFQRDLVAFSYETGRAKPDAALFAAPLASLLDRGIDSTDVVYVGNDMRNDVWCARQAGCMTALFAGDRRSLRTRADDPELRGLKPDTLIASLAELPGVCNLE